MAMISWKNRETERLVFLRSAAALLEAGFPLMEVLEDCALQAGSRHAGQQIKNISARVAAGDLPSAALASEPDIVPPLTVSLVRASEESGELVSAFRRAADIGDQRATIRREITGVLVYPTLVLVLAMGALMFLTWSVMPQILRMYASAGVSVPLVTRLALGAGRWLTYLITAGCVLAGLSLIPSVRQRILRVLRSLIYAFPPVRRLQTITDTLVWSHMLEALVHSAVPLPDALDITARSFAEESPLSRRILGIRSRIVNGESASDAFRKDSDMPKLVVRLIHSGDRAGDLGSALAKVTVLYENEYRIHLKRFTTFAEPVAIIITGLFVGLVALGIILPIADLGGLV